MRISFYTPFKPLDHANPSGDLMIARGLYAYLKNQGHKILIMSNFRSRWVFWKPWIWTWLIRDTRRIMRTIALDGVDLWFTYHSYYKAPDLLGALISRRLKIPYVIFQGIYATKRKRDWKTWPGFVLNRATLCAADHVFSNKKVDYLNMKRLLPSQRLTYVKPGISPHAFSFDAGARDELKKLKSTLKLKRALPELAVVLSEEFPLGRIATSGTSSPSYQKSAFTYSSARAFSRQ